MREKIIKLCCFLYIQYKKGPTYHKVEVGLRTQIQVFYAHKFLSVGFNYKLAPTLAGTKLYPYPHPTGFLRIPPMGMRVICTRCHL